MAQVTHHFRGRHHAGPWRVEASRSSLASSRLHLCNTAATDLSSTNRPSHSVSSAELENMTINSLATWLIVKVPRKRGSAVFAPQVHVRYLARASADRVLSFRRRCDRCLGWGATIHASTIGHPNVIVASATVKRAIALLNPGLVVCRWLGISIRKWSSKP